MMQLRDTRARRRRARRVDRRLYRLAVHEPSVRRHRRRAPRDRDRPARRYSSPSHARGGSRRADAPGRARAVGHHVGDGARRRDSGDARRPDRARDRDRLSREPHRELRGRRHRPGARVAGVIAVHRARLEHLSHGHDRPGLVGRAGRPRRVPVPAPVLQGAAAHPHGRHDRGRAASRGPEPAPAAMDRRRRRRGIPGVHQRARSASVAACRARSSTATTSWCSLSCR